MCNFQFDQSEPKWTNLDQSELNRSNLTKVGQIALK